MPLSPQELLTARAIAQVYAKATAFFADERNVLRTRALGIAIAWPREPGDPNDAPWQRFVCNVVIEKAEWMRLDPAGRRHLVVQRTTAEVASALASPDPGRRIVDPR